MDGGGPGNFDFCEYIRSGQRGTRELLEAVANQQQQEYCTDTECFTGSDPRGEGNAALFFMTFWFLMALVFYFLRPKTRVPPSDKSGDQAGPNYEPPAPPAPPAMS